MDAIQGAKNQALFREAANERLRDLNEAFGRELGETGRARRATGSPASIGSALPSTSVMQGSPSNPVTAAQPGSLPPRDTEGRGSPVSGYRLSSRFLTPHTGEARRGATCEREPRFAGSLVLGRFPMSCSPASTGPFPVLHDPEARENWRY